MSKARNLLPASVALLALGPGALAQSYTPRVLDQNGLLVGDAARRIRSGARACGLGLPPGSDQLPTLWDASGTSLLSLLAGDELGEANGFNSSGLVVGTSVDVVQMGSLTFFYEHAAYWQDGQIGTLDSLVTTGPPLELLRGVDVNEAGVILGWGRDPSVPTLRAFRLENGALEDLGFILPDGPVEPTDLTENGMICGTARAAGGRDHAFRWVDGVLTDLHVAGGVPGVVSAAHAMNESGLVVGTAEFDPGGPQWERAAMWTASGVVDLGLLGGAQSWAFSVNDQGDVVGGSTTDAQTTNAVLWRGGAIHDLNDLLPANSSWHLLTARGIANDGRIVGEGSFQGSFRAYLLEPECESCASYCVSTPNSTGSPALISAAGWESVAAGLFELRAEPVPANQPGLFYFGPEQVMAPFGNGVRCIGGGALGVFRLPVTNADAAGVLRHAVDFGAAPAAGRLVPGSTWNFQAWYRDPAAGGFQFDLSDGLSVQFVP